VFYGDPISPFLERWRPTPDPAVVAYAELLRKSFGEVRMVAHLPWDLAATLTSAGLRDVLELGVFGFLLALGEPGPSRKLLLTALVAFVLVILFGQLTPRFFLEPYLWCVAAVVLARWRPLKSLLFKLLIAQAAVVAGVAIYLGVLLFPGGAHRVGS
jgi:Protein of unknown function (DUF1420)